MWDTQRPKSRCSLGLWGSEGRWTMERAGAEALPEEAKTSLPPGPEDGQARMNFKLGRGRGESSLLSEPSTQVWDAHLHHSVREGSSACLLGP